MTKEELKEKIEAYEEIINDPSEDQTTRDFAAKKVLKLKDQIAPGYAVLSQTADGDGDSQEDGNEGNNANSGEEEIEVEEMEEEEVEEVVEEKPKKAPKKKKTTKKKGRGRPKKRGRPAKRKATKKAAPTKAKAKKMSKDLGLSVKECEDLLEKYNSEDKARKSRLAKRKKAGKSPDLSVSESLEKEVKTVKNKVEDKKTPTTKAQAKSQGSKITDLVKAILEGIDKKKDKITQIDAIIKGLVAEKKKIMAKKGTGAFLVGTALGGYAGYKLGLSKDKTALKDLFKGEKKLAKDFKDAVKDKQKKDETYTEFEEIYAKGGKIDRDEPIVEYLVRSGEREHTSLFRPKDYVITFDNTDYKFIGKRDATVEKLKAMDEEKLVQLMYGEDAEMTEEGVDIGDAYVEVHNIMTMGEYIDRGYAKGGKLNSKEWKEYQEASRNINHFNRQNEFIMVDGEYVMNDVTKMPEYKILNKKFKESLKKVTQMGYAKGGMTTKMYYIVYNEANGEKSYAEVPATSEKEAIEKLKKEGGVERIVRVRKMDKDEYAKGGEIKTIIEYQVEEDADGSGESYDNLDEAEMHWESLSDKQRKEGTLMKNTWECEDGVCDIVDTEIIYAKGGITVGFYDEGQKSMRFQQFDNREETKKFLEKEGMKEVKKDPKTRKEFKFYAKGGTTYDKEQDERIDENQNMSEEGVQLGDDALGLAQENEDKINNIRQGTSKVLNNLYEKNPSLKMAHGGVPKNAKWEYPIYFNSDDKEFVAIYYSNEEDVNEADEDFDNRTYNDITPDVIKEYVDDTSSSKSNYKFEERDVYELSKNDNFMDALEYALETSSISPEKVGYAKGGEIEDMSYEELMEVVMEKNSSNQNEKLAKEIAKIQEFKYDADDGADFNLVVQDYLDKSTNKNDDEAREVLIQAFENTGTSYAKGGKTPKLKVRKSFYRTTLGANEKTGTGEDMRNVYHLHIEGTGSGQNYLLHSSTVTDEFLKENAPGGYDSGFYVDEEVYVDFTDKDGNKKKGYMIVNNPDLAVRILRDKYNAVSIEGMLMEWEMEEKGKNFDDYTDSY
jgi:hypothetical protein